MEETIQISSFSVTIFGSLISLLLLAVAFFLNRLISQFDKLQTQFGKLNDTMTKIDKDLSGDVGVLKSRMQEFDPLWDRLRSAENSIVAIQSGGCDAYHSKLHSQ